MNAGIRTVLSLCAGYGGLEMSSKRDCNGLKHCVECFRALCESSFSKRSDAKDGLQAVCKECQRTLKKNWIVANYDHVVESNRQWNQSHPQIALNRVNRWKSDNPYKARLNSQKTAQTRRARKKAAFVESITPIIVFERDGWLCGICGKLVGREDASIDHIMPLSKGGLHSYVNVQTSHLRCNVRKQAKICG